MRLGIIHRNAIHRNVDAGWIGASNPDSGVSHARTGIRIHHHSGLVVQQKREILPEVAASDLLQFHRGVGHGRFVIGPRGRNHHLVGKKVPGAQYNDQSFGRRSQG